MSQIPDSIHLPLYGLLQALKCAATQNPSFTLLVAASSALLIIFSRRKTGNAAFEAPSIDRSIAVLARLDFFRHGKDIIERGCREFKDQICKVMGNDMLILPPKYADELRHVPDTHLSATKGMNTDLQEHYTSFDTLGGADLHIRVVNMRLTPSLGSLVGPMHDELQQSLNEEIPKSDKSWQAVNAFQTILAIASPMIARPLVGAELCRNEKWMATSHEFTEDLFKIVNFFRLLPPWTKPLIAFFYPAAWRVKHHVSVAHEILKPRILEQRRLRVDEEVKTRRSDFTNFLEAMDEEAEGSDLDTQSLSKRMLFIGIAAFHTVVMATTQAVFDLCQHPEHIAELREELETVLDAEGGWSRQTLPKLRKLDSFVKESQRFHPPALLGFRRGVLQPIELSSGEIIPAGAHIVMPTLPQQNENPALENPELFDGFRWAKVRQRAGEQNKHQYGMTDNYTIHFGRGKYACPGRFLAANSIKIILGQLLLDCDFRFPSGQGRPKDMFVIDNIFPDPAAQIELKRRRKQD